MKRYKRILIVAPLACMLSAGVFTLPNAAHADSTVRTAQVLNTKDEAPFSAAQLEKDINDRLSAASNYFLPEGNEYINGYVYPNVDLSNIKVTTQLPHGGFFHLLV